MEANQGNRFETAMKTRIGSCRERAVACMIYMKSHMDHMSRRVRCMMSPTHAWIEVYFQSNWVTMDLGGDPRGHSVSFSEPQPKKKQPEVKVICDNKTHEECFLLANSFLRVCTECCNKYQKTSRDFAEFKKDWIDHHVNSNKKSTC